MRAFTILLLGATFFLSSCTTINLTDPDLGAKTGSSTPAKSADADKKKDPPFKPWKEILKDTRAINGFFNLHLKRDQKLFLEIQPDQIGMDIGFMSHFSKGTGVFDIHDGLYLTTTRIMRFRRVGDTMYLVHMNMRFTADEGSPMRNSLDDNVGHSIIGSFPIQTQHDTTKAVVIDFTGFIVSDYMQLANRIKPYFGNRAVQFVKDKSYVDQVMSFEKNVEIDAMLTYKPNGNSSSSSAGVSTVSSIPVGVRYSFFALPDDPMTPRLADDRVGYFMGAQRDFSRDKSPDQMIRYINRWRLDKKDPTAAVSDPVKPITYYIDRSVPHEYRQWVREGIEGWQKAYEAAGFSNAIIALDAPDDSTWSAEDMRYSTVRWTAAHSMGYAIGPSQTDVRTGEILNADILLSSTFMLGWTSEWQNLVGENGMLTRMEEMQRKMQMMSPGELDRVCLAQFGKQYEIGLLQTALLADATVIGEVPAEFYGPSIRDLVFHEVGHTLGLRHNFRGSGAIPYDKLQDKEYTKKNGLTLSVMDYAGTNINPDRDNQGYYVNEEVGSYDLWAITFGYSAAPEGVSDADHAESIARQAADPMHAYNTDGDTHLGPYSVDPLSSTWDLTSDPMAYAVDQMNLVKQIIPVIEDRLVGEGDGYSRLRGAVNGLLFTQYRQLASVAKMVGGSYFSRDHKGDPNGRVPFTPVSATDQRNAVKFILDNAVGMEDFPFSEELLNKTPPSRHDDWNSRSSPPVDLPIHESVLRLQMNTLSTLTDRRRLSRMINNELHTADNYTVAELLETVSDAVYSSLGSRSISSFDRNLQLVYAEYLGAMMNNLRPSPFVPVAPNEARALARLELTELKVEIADAQQASGLDRVTEAHLGELAARVKSVFNLKDVKEVK